MNPPVVRIYHHGSRKWVVSQPNVWVDGAWGQAVPEDSGVWFGSVYAPYLAEGTVFTRDVAAMPLHEHSAKIAAYLPVMTYETTQRMRKYQDDPALSGPGHRPLQDFGPRGVTSLNVRQFNIPVYVVDSSMPGCDLAPMTAAAVTGEGAQMVSGLVPIPRWATPSDPAGWGDLAMAIYDRHTGIMREYFGCAKDADGRWTARSSGYYHARPRFEGLRETNHAMQLSAGRSAVVGLLSPLLQVGIAEARSGEIGHALGFTLADGLNRFSWPATAGDGMIDPADNPDLLPAGFWPPAQGQWFRLPPDLDLESLRLRPFTRVLARGATVRRGGDRQELTQPRLQLRASARRAALDGERRAAGGPRPVGHRHPRQVPGRDRLRAQRPRRRVSGRKHQPVRRQRLPLAPDAVGAAGLGQTELMAGKTEGVKRS